MLRSPVPPYFKAITLLECYTDRYKLDTLTSFTMVFYGQKSHKTRRLRKTSLVPLTQRLEALSKDIKMAQIHQILRLVDNHKSPLTPYIGSKGFMVCSGKVLPITHIG